VPAKAEIQTFQPSGSYEEALERACQIWGVQKDYWDIFGKFHVAPPDAQASVLQSMGIPSRTTEELDQAVEKRLWEDWRVPTVSTLVVSLSDGMFPVHLVKPDPGIIRVVFEWEGGASETVECRRDELKPISSARLRGVDIDRLGFPLPSSAGPGYHTLRVVAGVESSSSRLILCPDRAWQPTFLAKGAKGAGIAISLYGLRSARNWGCGDFTDLKAFTDWAIGSLGVSFVALNPLHSIPNRQPYNTSPYLPNCSFYRNPLYLDVEAIEDVAQSRLAQEVIGGARFQACLAEVRNSKYVEYERVWKLKQQVLKVGFREFLRRFPEGTLRRRAFEDYVAAEGELLHRFAIYQALDERLHKRDPNCWIWPDWPEPYRDPDSAEVRDFAAENRRLILFYKWMQWQLDMQLAGAQAHAKEREFCIGLYHDLALATDRCGSDLWAHRPFYVAGCRVGSPPDDFSPKGQDWAFPPPNSAHHHDTGYRLFTESIRKNCRHGGALRIDHVMRFFRLFWIPDGSDATQGVYVHDLSDDLLRILALESVRNHVLMIGEDLGTVEPWIRTALRKYGILSYRLLYFEKRKDGSFRRPDEYPREALVSVSTHDLPTLAGFWLGRDIEARRNAGVLPDEASYREQVAGRAAEKQRMLDVMWELRLLPVSFPRKQELVPDFTSELHQAAVGFLANTPSELMVLNQEDLFKEADQQNLPGTTEQYPNWRHKMRHTIEELHTDSHAQACAAMFRMWLQRTGRLNQPPCL